ncbi:AbiH family protein [Providencia rettgeri]|nr:AbiH family protein [Providencia rettgeri]
MRLYIIGNGFDIRHGLPTGYKHFKSYVAKNDQELYDSIEEYIPAGDEWNELESALGEIDMSLSFKTVRCFWLRTIPMIGAMPTITITNMK